jgi:hypothetical protein
MKRRLSRGDWLTLLVFTLTVGGGLFSFAMSWWLSSAAWAAAALGFFGALLLPWVVLVVILFLVLIFGGLDE